MRKLSLAYVSAASPPTVFPFISPSHSTPPLSPAAAGKMGMWTHTSLPSLTAPLAPCCNITPSKASSSLPHTAPLFLSQHSGTACLIYQELSLLGIDLYGFSRPILIFFLTCWKEESLFSGCVIFREWKKIYKTTFNYKRSKPLKVWCDTHCFLIHYSLSFNFWQ